MREPVQAGIDLVDIVKLTAMLSNYDTNTLLYLFTLAEQHHCQKIMSTYSLALSFSAKEAVGKALGVGLAGLNWYDIQIFPQEDQTLDIVLTGDALKLSERLLIKNWFGYWHFLSESICVTAIISQS